MTEQQKLVPETVEALSQAGKKPSDVLWVGSADGIYACSWDAFATRFDGVVYDSGFGCQDIAKDLVVVGADWWLERGEYDGSEWWDFKAAPIKQSEALSFDKIKGCGWRTVAQIMAGEDE